MGLTTDATDPRLGHGVDAEPIPQHEVYLVLSPEERAKGFVRPLRRSYTHVGPTGPENALRDLTKAEVERWGQFNYAKFEPYPPREESSLTGRFWTHAQLDAVGKGCNASTKMGLDLCETYAREPKFYGATYCVGCQMHKAVGEFVWDEDGQVVGS